MNIWDYKVSNPFSATHSGEDRAAPSGTPIPVAGELIGYVGSTGKSTGPHCHIQRAEKVNGAWKFVHPRGGGKVVNGVVSEIVNNAEVGHCVRILANNGERWSYFHMRDKPLVKVGQVIGGDMSASQTKVDATTVALVYNLGLNRNASAEEINGWAGKTVEELLRAVWGSSEHTALLKGNQVTRASALEYINKNLR